MSQPVGPALARARLATRLKRLRGDRPAADVAKAMHWSLSKLNRIENSKVTISAVEVEALAKHYGVAGSREVARLKQLSLDSRQRMWWREHHLAEDFLNYIAFEHDSTHLYSYQATFCPGLVQTKAYAEVLTSAILRQPVHSDAVQDVVGIRMKRQDSLHERLSGESPPRLSLAIDEAALRRPVGGHEVMAEQIDRLLKLNDHPLITIVVIPMDLGAHAGLGGPFELLTFSEDDDLDVVYIETPAIDFLLTDAKETAAFPNIMKELLDTDTTGESLAAAAERARRAFIG
jgi:transcriptional regulator with XRE-family HTH domain